MPDCIIQLSLILILISIPFFYSSYCYKFFFIGMSTTNGFNHTCTGLSIVDHLFLYNWSRWLCIWRLSVVLSLHRTRSQNYHYRMRPSGVVVLSTSFNLFHFILGSLLTKAKWAQSRWREYFINAIVRVLRRTGIPLCHIGIDDVF